MRLSALGGLLVLGGCAAFAEIESAQTFVEEVVLPATTDEKRFALITSDTFKETTSAEQQEKLFQVYAQLGSFKQSEPASCSVVASANTDAKLNGTFANCQVAAEYANGSAIVAVLLRKTGESWLVDGVTINSPLFVELMSRGSAPASAQPAAEPSPTTP